MRLLLIVVSCCLIGAFPIGAHASQKTNDGWSAKDVAKRLQQATVRIVSNGDRSSGVLVSEAGHILTVAHGLHGESQKVSIVFAGGSRAEAIVFRRDQKLDIAVLKLTEESSHSTLDPLPLTAVVDLQKGQTVLSAGCPGRESDGLMPVIRLGVLLAVEPSTLRSSCILTAGDSGGPLINHQGHLIGLNRQIGLSRESNHHLPLNRILDFLSSDAETKAIITATSAKSDNAEVMVKPNDRVQDVWRERCVEIFQGNAAPESDANPRILGTLLDPEHVATKLSALTPSESITCRRKNGDTCSADIMTSDVASDIAILKLGKPYEGVTTLVTAPEISAKEFSLCFAGFESTSAQCAGLMTRCRHNEPRLRGKLGAILEYDEPAKAVRVKDVAPNSTAAAAKLTKGCLIESINQQSVPSLDAVGLLLSDRQPGDWLHFQFRVNKESFSADAIFQHDPAERFERTEFLDGRSGMVSERRSGFEEVLQHDIDLTPVECGSPLIDNEGRVVGLNIARRARESSLAIPLENVMKLLTVSTSSTSKP